MRTEKDYLKEKGEVGIILVLYSILYEVRTEKDYLKEKGKVGIILVLYSRSPLAGSGNLTRIILIQQ